MMIRAMATVMVLGLASLTWADGPKKPEKGPPWAGYNQGVRWESSLDAAMKKARESNKPLLIHQLVGHMKTEGC